MQSFAKAHARYLECACLRKAQTADRFRLRNDQTPAEPHIPEPMRAELGDNFGTIRTLLSILGVPFLDPLATKDRRRILRCTGKQADAKGEYTEEGLVVFECSTARPNTTPSVGEVIPRRRQRLQEDGVLVRQDDRLVFAEDQAFNSPSGAAGVVLGRKANGWRERVDADGRTLDELERQ